MKSTDPPIILEFIFYTSTNKVWNAITRIDEMLQWYFDNIKDFHPEVGFRTKFEVYSGDRKFTHLWKVTEVIPGQKITYNWKYEEYPGDSFVTFELIEEENHVKLRLSLEVIESFPSEVPEFTRESCILGWDYFLGKKLHEYLETNS